MKKLMSLLLVFALLLPCLPMVASAASGSCGENVTWTLDASGTLSISGSGAMADYASASDTPWYGSRTSVKEILIGSRVTAIGDRAFYGCTALEYVSFGSAVTTVGVYAFRGCTALKSVTIPANVEELRASAFRACTALESVLFEGDAPAIANYVFHDGSASLVICYYEDGQGFDGAHWAEYSLKALHVGKRVVDKAPTCTEAGSCRIACSYCDETVIEVIPATGHAYVDGICTACRDVQILASGDCGDDVTWVLEGTGRLTISGTGPMGEYDAYRDGDEDGSWWESDVPWFSKSRVITSVVIEEGVTSIGYAMFADCRNLTSVKIPESVTRIESHAFDLCKSLPAITLPDSITYIGGYAFSDCRSLKYFTFPDTVTDISDSLFLGCSSLTSIILPENITSMGYGVFSGCRSLTSFEIPEEITEINGLFSYCTGLTSIDIPESVTTIGSSAFAGCTGLTSIDIPESVTSIGSCAFQSCTGLTSIDIPESVTSIGSCAFQFCTGLKSIVIPESVTSIDGSVFYGCTALCNVILPSGLTEISDSMFSHCTSLESIEIPESVTSIGDSAFNNCTALTNIVIPEGVTEINYGLFWCCSNLTSVDIPSSVTTIEENAFYHCESLDNVAIPDGVTAIKEDTFYGCDSLKTIVIPASVTSIGDYAFPSWGELRDVYYGGTAAQWTALGDNTPSADYIHYSCTDPTDHWEEKFVEATCQVGGYTRQYCDCGYQIKGPEEVPAIGEHIYKNGVCKYCGAKYSQKKPVLEAQGSASSGKPYLSWTRIDGAKTYKVYRSTKKSGTYSCVATVTGNTYTDKTAKAGTTYYYKVRGVDGNGNKSGYSAVVSHTCDLPQPKVKAKNVASSGKISLSWETVSGASKYTVYRATSSGGTYSKLGTTTKTSYTDSSAKAGKKYYYKVVALHENSAANSARSAAASCTCDLARPNVTVKLKSNGDPILSWKKVSGSQKYYVYRATSSSGTYKKIKTTTATSFTDKTAKAGKTYYYKVKAIHSNSSAHSAYSAVDKIRAK